MEFSQTRYSPRNPRTKDFNLLDPRSKKTSLTTKTQEQTERTAQYLVDKFNAPEFKPLFLKVAWRLERGTIDRHVASAFELGKNPRAYFISCVKREKAYNDG